MSAAPRHAMLGPAIRRIVIEQSRRAHVGHIGSALSIADLVGALYGGGLRIDGPDDPERDVFVLSKGHAALALYAALHLRGWVDREQLDTFCGDESLLGVHPEHQVPGIEVSTGSLGHGLSVGAGRALGARLRGSRSRSCVLLSDAEYDEGSTWEAAMFAGHHRLANLVAVVDLNGQQALGHTRDVLDVGAAGRQWEAFGWDVHEVDGHDEHAIAQLVASFDGGDRRPHVVVAHTTFGRGVSFMEGQVRWHYLPMDDEQYATALAEIGVTA